MFNTITAEYDGKEVEKKKKKKWSKAETKISQDEESRNV